MEQREKGLFRRGWDWFAERAHSRHAKAWLAGISFSESSFFIIPPDVLLGAMLLVDSRPWLRLALITTVSSVLGGLFGYAIGALLFGSVGAALLSWYHLDSAFETARNVYATNALAAVLIASFTPIPYKVFVIAGGFFNVPLLTFLVASIIGRGARFFLVAAIFRFFGAPIRKLLFTYINVFGLIVAAAVFALILKNAGLW